MVQVMDKMQAELTVLRMQGSANSSGSQELVKVNSLNSDLVCPPPLPPPPPTLCSVPWLE